MAETKKKQAAGSSPRKSAASEAEKRRAELLARNAQRRRLLSVILFAVGILITAFALFGKAEGDDLSAWDAIHTFIHGVFGISAFLVGPVLIYVAVMLSAERTRATIAKRMIQLLLMILLLSAAAQVIFVGSVGDPASAEPTLGENVSYAYENGTRLIGGGVSGLILGTPLLLFGQAGAVIILLLVTLVIFMLMTNLTVVDLLRAISKPFRKAGSYAKEKREIYREESALAEDERKKREEEEARRRREEKEKRGTDRKPRVLSDEEERARKFAAIESVTTNAQREVTEEEKREAARKNAEAAAENPVAVQKKESREFQKDLNAFLNGKIEKREDAEEKAAREPSEENRADGDGPYRPNGPFFADEQPPEPIKPEIISEPRESLIGQSNIAIEPAGAVESAAAAEPEAEKADEGDRIVEAIREFSREQEESAQQEEKREEKLLTTVIRADENGQGHFEDIFSETEQYKVPPSELLNDVIHERSDEDIHAEIESNAEKLVNTLKSFGVQTKFLEASRGPSVTRYELQPAPGVKIAKITGLVDDIALNLAAAGVRIEAPIPNKAAVGIEVPNKTVESVPFREMVESKAFTETKSKLGAVLGKSISGEVVIADIAKMPHILIAGTTGSGKSVCVNSIIMSILFRSTPDDVRLLMIDPKAVEFMIYNGIPHLLIPVVTDPKKAAGALAWAVTEMLHRYKLFSDHNVRDLGGYNALAKNREDLEPLPQVVIFIDELADLMMASPGEVEDSICRLAQMARAAGMHLVIATQRPSVNVVTGVIKANIPSRIALKVASQVDSRTILDSAGAEKLLGKGDMLYFPVGMPKPLRVQGCWVSDKEVERVVDFIKNSFILDYDQDVMDEIEKQAELAAQKNGKNKEKDEEDGGEFLLNDDKLDEAIEAVIEAGQASTSYLQRKLKLGYGRAARLIDTMEQLGVVGPYEGSKPRQVVMTKQEWYERKLNKEE